MDLCKTWNALGGRMITVALDIKRKAIWGKGFPRAWCWLKQMWGMKRKDQDVDWNYIEGVLDWEEINIYLQNYSQTGGNTYLHQTSKEIVKLTGVSRGLYSGILGWKQRLVEQRVPRWWKKDHWVPAVMSIYGLFSQKLKEIHCEFGSVLSLALCCSPLKFCNGCMKTWKCKDLSCLSE